MIRKFRNCLCHLKTTEKGLLVEHGEAWLGWGIVTHHHDGVMVEMVGNQIPNPPMGEMYIMIGNFILAWNHDLSPAVQAALNWADANHRP
ncbi:MULTISPECIES: hypothetical protein [unclassified Sphingobium]|uniref:hypothetical protein n=1 Tax=unclassified Sphingobium TaxID=2611147 RepID=UPI0035A5D83F